MNVPLNDVISEILEPLARSLMESDEVISSEHMLHELDKLNQKWASESWDPGAQPPCLLAADASCLYPSLDHKLSAEIVRKEVLRSNLNLKGTNWHEMVAAEPFAAFAVFSSLFEVRGEQETS